ncbi:MAG: cell division protein FtsZ, partial [Microvirga sp.]
SSKARRVIQMGTQATGGLGAGAQPDVGRAAAEEAIDEIRDHLTGAHMVFITAGMGGGTGTGAAPVIARAARDMGILTVGVVTKPFQFEGVRRARVAESGVNELQAAVDTLIVIPNQNLFRVANEKTTFADAFAMADQVLYSGVACITDLMVKEGLINLDFADVRSVMRGMGKAMMGTGEASGEKRAIRAAEAAIANPLLDDVSMKGARGLLISITGGNDLTLYELDEAATRIREEVDQDANIILGATFDESLEGIIRVSVVATGIDHALLEKGGDLTATEQRISEVAERLRAEARARATPTQPAPTFRSAAQAESVKAAPILNQGTPVLASAHVAAPAPMAAAQPLEPALQPVIRDDVVLTPAQPRQALAYEAPAPQQPVYEEPVEQGAFIPPQAERAMRPARMPRIDELPMPAQNQIRASRGEEPAHEHKPSLIQRLATIGFGRREEPQHAPAEPRQEAPRQPMSSVHAEYARRPMPPQAQRPPQAPMAPAPRAPSEDDQLEIPAFLRRQAN